MKILPLKVVIPQLHSAVPIINNTNMLTSEVAATSM